MVDRMDCLVLLLHLIKEQPVTEENSELLLSFSNKVSTAITLIRSTADGRVLVEEDLNLISSTILEVGAFFGDKYEQLANPVNWGGNVPLPLFVDCPGAQPPERINHISSFKVRGKNYMNDRKKVSRIRNFPSSLLTDFHL